MKKKELATVLGLSVALTMTGCASNEINQIKSETTVEVGSECNIEATEYFELGSKVDASDIVIDKSSVDTSTVGDYEITVSFKNNIYSISVSVVDTVAPVLSIKDNNEKVERGASIVALDYAEVEDKSDVNVFWVTDNGEIESIVIPEDLDSSVTEINYTLVAIDKYGNRSEEKQITIHTTDTSIQEEPKKEVETTESQYDHTFDVEKQAYDELLRDGEITPEQYEEFIKEAEEDAKRRTGDKGGKGDKGGILDTIPSTPGVVDAHDCGTCIASDSGNCDGSGDCCITADCGYCNIQ